MVCLSEGFYEQEVTVVARLLLGMRLVRKNADGRLAGIILETEAYRGEEDLACHARAGRTHRTAVMYGKAGRAYVYFTYGMHWMLNVVTGPEGFPAAVLIRSIHPVEGIDQIKSNRNDRPDPHLCDGPAKICRALNIDGTLNGIALFDDENSLWIEQGKGVSDLRVRTSPRVGLGKTPEPWKSIPWRYSVDCRDLIN